MASPAAPNGPTADYPVVLGAPFTVEGITYTPADTLNYDQVGHALIDSAAPAGISLAHRTLPLPSYVEVTSLESGRTILARVERRGPAIGKALVALSPDAATQIGLAAGTLAVRVRRVNPPEAERALLRAGQRAALRMDTPMSLVAVLLRRLDGAVPAAPPPPLQPPAVTPASTPAPAAGPITPPSATAFAVQVGAFSTPANAARAAREVGGVVLPGGRFHLVRITGFSSAVQAGPALAKARAAGYSDARILRAD